MRKGRLGRGKGEEIEEREKGLRKGKRDKGKGEGVEKREKG